MGVRMTTWAHHRACCCCRCCNITARILPVAYDPGLYQAHGDCIMGSSATDGALMTAWGCAAVARMGRACRESPMGPIDPW